ncbi:MAG: hypothetical protein WB778_03580 [Thermoplasmata archaeon]|jgi:uncharacterized membrane protein (DUF106 family)
MKASRVALVLWAALIVILLLVEIAEITHTFTLPIASAIGDPLAFVFALVFTTILAMVGAIFIGVYVSQRMQYTSGFTPFEEEMLKMRSDVRELKTEVAELRTELGNGAPKSTPPAELNPPGRP